MTRRRAFLLLLGALVAVYVVGGVVGVGVTRARLLGDIDDRLRVTVKSLDALTAELPLDLEDFAATREGDRVALLVSPEGTVLFERMPESVVDNLGRPDVSGQEIVAHPDDVFTVPFAQGHEMDPTADQRGVSTKVGIDATYKRERREYGERVSYPPIDLGQYLR